MGRLALAGNAGSVKHAFRATGLSEFAHLAGAAWLPLGSYFGVRPEARIEMWLGTGGTAAILTNHVSPAGSRHFNYSLNVQPRCQCDDSTRPTHKIDLRRMPHTRTV
jgi:hypothetical protein